MEALTDHKTSKLKSNRRTIVRSLIFIYLIVTEITFHVLIASSTERLHKHDFQSLHHSALYLAWKITSAMIWTEPDTSAKIQFHDNGNRIHDFFSKQVHRIKHTLKKSWYSFLKEERIANLKDHTNYNSVFDIHRATDVVKLPFTIGKRVSEHIARTSKILAHQSASHIQFGVIQGVIKLIQLLLAHEQRQISSKFNLQASLYIKKYIKPLNKFMNKLNDSHIHVKASYIDFLLNILHDGLMMHDRKKPNRNMIDSNHANRDDNNNVSQVYDQVMIVIDTFRKYWLQSHVKSHQDQTHGQVQVKKQSRDFNKTKQHNSRKSADYSSSFIPSSVSSHYGTFKR